jgi:hypothetical protein
MNPGRNTTKRKKMTAAATLALFAGAAFLVAVPATAQVSLLGSGAGSADALWGQYLGGDAKDSSPTVGTGSQAPTEQHAGADQGLDGTVHTAAEAAAGVDLTPPDAQPTIDAASSLVMQASDTAEAQANALLDTAMKTDAGMAATWGAYGSGDGSYDVVLGGDYGGSGAGLGGAHAEKQVDQKVDVRGEADAVNGASAEAQGTVNGLLAQFESVWNGLYVGADLGLHGAMKALGDVGFDVAGVFGMHQAANLVNLDSIDADHQLDIENPAKLNQQVELPEVQVPSIALDQGGQVAMDAQAIAEGAIHG